MKQKQRGSKWRLILWLFFSTALSTVTLGQDRQRYLALLMLNLDDRPNEDLDLLQEAAKSGCNAVNMTVQWDVVYPTANSAPNWQKYDNQINLCQKLGLKVAIRISLSRTMRLIPGFWTAAECQRDDRGKTLETIYSKTAFSFAHRPTVEKARGFIREVCQRYDSFQKQGLIAWVAVTTIPGQEIGYDFTNWVDGSGQNTYHAVYDYAPAAQDEFKVFLSRKYKKITRLNANWETQYARFEDVGLPTSPKNPFQVFQGSAGKDWYVFRHLMLRNFVEQTTESIRAVNAAYRVVLDFGSVFDDLSGLRGAYGFADLGQNLDGVKINDDVSYDNRFSTDVVRSNVDGKWVLNEVFTDEKYSKEAIIKQIDQNFAHGTRWMNVLVGTIPSLNRIKDVLQKTNEKWVKTPFMDVVPQRSMACSLAQLVEFGYFQGGVYAQWANQAGPESNRQPVQLKIIDDLLNDSLQGSVNRPPVLRNALPNKIIKVNTPFSYQLSPEVFVDIDGLIAKVEAIGLPSWLTFANNVFSGTPPRVGNFQFMVRATDDDGATVETTFMIGVDNNGRVNQKPILKKKIPDLAGLYKQAIIFQIPDGTFADPDGFISRIEVTGLPKWATYRKGEIRGVADEVGTYPVGIKVYDDEGATAETAFNIVVTYPRVFFDLIQGGPPGKRFLLQRLQPTETLLAHNLPDLLNIYAACEVPFDTFDLQISGPYVKTIRLVRAPYALFEGSGGFPTVAGKYQLKGTAYFRQQLVASTIYTFSILPTDPLTKQPRTLEDWAVYPNPFDEFLNVKLPAQFAKQNWQLELTNLSGQLLPLPSRFATLTDSLLSLNLSQSGLAGGLYLMKISNKEGDYKVFKIIKR